MLIPPLETMLDQIRAALSAEPVTIDTLPAVDQAATGSPPTAARASSSSPPAPIAATRRSPASSKTVRRAAPDATGPAVATQAAAHTVAMAFVEAGLLALVAISLLLLAVLRDVREVRSRWRRSCCRAS